MSKRLNVSDAIETKFYENSKGLRMLCCGTDPANPKFTVFMIRRPGIMEMECLRDEFITPCPPDCDSFDWQPPKPEPQYRPFANAAEFAPHRDRWLIHQGETDGPRHRVTKYSDTGADFDGGAQPWDWAFEYYQFEDGTPFGVEAAHQSNAGS